MAGAGFRFSLVALGIALLATADGVGARTYKWVDDRGTTHYSQFRPTDRPAKEMAMRDSVDAVSDAGEGCDSLSCRAARLGRARREREATEQKIRDAAARAARRPVFPTHVEETDDEKIARLVAECKRSRGARCDSDEEKRRMLLKHVDLTHAERRALRGLSPAAQRRVLLRRIPKRFRHLD